MTYSGSRESSERAVEPRTCSVVKCHRSNQSEPGNCIMTATAKRTRLADRMRTPQSKPRLRAVKRKALDVDPAQLNRAVQAINQADKRDDWFDFLRNV